MHTLTSLFVCIRSEMGTTHSTKIVSQREAEAMLSAEEYVRFKNAFDRIHTESLTLKVKGEKIVDKNAFKYLMLSDFPEMVGFMCLSYTRLCI